MKPSVPRQCSWLSAAVLVVALAAAPPPARGASLEREAQRSEKKSRSDLYLVRMLGEPVVAYQGGIPGLKATRPSKGQKIDPHSPEVVRYVGHLDARHDALLARAGGRKVYGYRYSFNGFAARLTPAELERVKASPDVVSVEKDVLRVADTSTTPAFIGLTDPASGLRAKHGLRGEDIIIGVIDSGIWPESESFSDRTRLGPNDQAGKLGYQEIPGWHGKCVPGEAFTGSHCNQKLIGARYYADGRGLENILPHEFLSPRDFNGHGTHTASTAAGNEGVAQAGLTAAFGPVSGMAPRARIAAYKALWDNGDATASGSTVDLVAAIDQAVADGVDVLNYSISGTSTNYTDAVEVAFLFAADAGVFVATSAGNNGPTASTVAHISPWLASVAAGTHSRSGSATVTLGNGATFSGFSLMPAAGPAPLVLATAVRKADAPSADAALCFPGTLDPAQTAGKVVLCDRGVNARIEKSQVVRDAGGAGMILANVTPASLNADLHFLPTVHVDHVAGAAIKAYLASGGSAATAALSQGRLNTDLPAPDVASFSSRGPSRAGGGDILKPDFMLPGQDILAAVAPPGNSGRSFDLYSGTSMSSPHVAGVAALLKEAHPGWSPAALRSAMATTAMPASVSTTSPFAIGSGHVVPNLALDPGLVYDAGFDDYLAFLKGQGLCCAGLPEVPALDASDLNQPSIAFGDLAGSQTVTRTVTNVGGARATYSAAVSAPAGFTVAVSPSTFTLAPGASQEFSVTVTRTASAPLNTFRFGSLTWSDGAHGVRSPLVVRPVALAAPAQVSGTGTSGSTTWTIKAGYTGALALAPRGLVPAATAAGRVVDDPTDNFDTAAPDANQGITKHTLDIPAGTTHARISLFDDFTDGADDLDLYVYREGANGTLTLVGSSGSGTSAEEVNLSNPAAARYIVYVHGWETDGPDANYTLFTWVLGTASAGNMTVSGPSSAVTGAVSNVNLSWSGLSPATKYLGSVVYQEGATTHATTLVRIDG